MYLSALHHPLGGATARIPTRVSFSADKPLAFCQGHEESLLPILSKAAQVYLGMTSSSVPVECMCSTTRIISNWKRSGIGPEKLKRVVFIHDNFSLAVDECK